MSTVNKVILIGNLGADPEVKHTTTGKAVAELRLATSMGKGDDSVTEWHKVILWEKLADVASAYLTKGSKVYVEGRIQTRTYDDKEGVKRYITEIVGQNLTMLSPKADGAADEATERAAPKPNKAPNRSQKTKAKFVAVPDVDLEF